MYSGAHFGPWLSLVERLVRVEEVEGSNPSGPTMLIFRDLQKSGSQTKTPAKTLSAFDHFRPGTFERPLRGILT